jgi:polyhydroxyalkanoate synthesis repressor PhaR
MHNLSARGKEMAKSKPVDGAPVVIKKYANRRLYNTETSSYITLDNLAAMVREGRDFQVVDAKSGEDITHNVLTQIIVEAEGKGASMLPSGFLRQIISLYGDSMQAMVPQYLEESMDAFRSSQSQFRGLIDNAFAGSPFEDLHKRNMAVLEAASSMLRPGKKGATPKPEKSEADDVAALKAQLAELQSKIERLGK